MGRVTDTATCPGASATCLGATALTTRRVTVETSSYRGSAEMTTEVLTEQGIVRIPAGTWHVDPNHSSIEFEIKHMMIATVRGRFKEFEGTLTIAEEIEDSQISGVVKVASIDTNQPDRDAHLRAADFFDVERYPEIRFTSTRIEPRGGADFSVIGDLTIKDVTRQVELATTIEGVQRDPWGNDRIGVAMRGAIDRRKFGLVWQQALETGGFLLGDNVKIFVDVSAVRG
jgi:polyisoprenoid-binding protein YceI